MASDQYGVVGHPVAHSWSPFIHAMFARETGQDIAYRLYDFAPEEFHVRVRELFAQGGRGLNITLPYKITALDVVSDVTDRAHHAEAINTLALQSDGRILGDNTDGAGLIRDLCVNLGIVIEQRRILMVGAGGAARGVLGPLLAQRPTEVVIANRTPERAQELAAAFARLGPVRGVGFSYVSGRFDLVINATSASLTGEIPPLPVAVIGPETLCYDMAYGKTDLPFLQWALERGCARAVQGLGMLVEQAAESFELWRGVRPTTGPVLAALQQRLNAS